NKFEAFATKTNDSINNKEVEITEEELNQKTGEEILIANQKENMSHLSKERYIQNSQDPYSAAMT
ncbi:hypothetical protein HAX54_008888, partial [Datura stramonium]|nr:hypothetical protein [Datura stramonium]